MTEVSSIINWIEGHPVSSGLIVTVLLALITGIVALIRLINSDRIALKIIIRPSKIHSKLNAERKSVHTLIGLSVMIANHSKVPVSIAQFYLDLPGSIAMYQNYFHLYEEGGIRRSVPIHLDAPVVYLFGDLTDEKINKSIFGKKVRFVAIDQKGKSHYSNRLKISHNVFLAEANKIR